MMNKKILEVKHPMRSAIKGLEEKVKAAINDHGGSRTTGTRDKYMEVEVYHANNATLVVEAYWGIEGSSQFLKSGLIIYYHTGKQSKNDPLLFGKLQRLVRQFKKEPARFYPASPSD